MNIGSKERNYSCLYCGYVSKDLDVIKDHEERIHSCYRDLNPRTPKSSKKETPQEEIKYVDGFGRPWNRNYIPKHIKELSVYAHKKTHGDIIRIGDNEYEKSNGRFILISDSDNIEYPLNKGKPEYFEKDDRKYYKCLNCGTYNSFLLDPYTYWSLPQKKRMRIPKDATPLVLCRGCGMNIFKDNRKRMLDYINKGNRVPDGINMDVVMSVKPKIEDLVLRNI